MAIENQPALASNLLTFYDNYETPLPAGAYRFVLQQTVSVAGEQPVHYYRDQAFEVVAPRYVIEESEIQAYFPPQGGVADYQNILPHLVLRTRNLPWERSVWADSGREPWLVLLMLSEQDVLEGQAAAHVGTVADLKPQQQTSTHRSRTENGAAILLPKFIRDDDPQTPVRLLDLDLKLFLKLCPRREELPMLAHIRRVDTANKVPLEMAADGEFSVLVGNRFPSEGANTIYLISLEGWSDLIDADAEQSHPASRLRLIILGGWNFVSDPAGNDTFGGLLRRLRDNAAVFGVKPPASGHAYVNQALARGYVPLDYQPLNSTQTFAWYRGPLAPLAVKQRKQQAFERADAALIFDEQTAVMDVSYAAAWQLGRLLALASPAFSKGLRLFVERYQNALGFADEIANFINLHRSSFTDLKPDNTEPVNEQIAIADDLVRWIAQLVLLYPVPFHYLVPHPALLPPESLRFFHLDDNWVDALVDGALSVAVRSLADQGVASRADLQSALSKIVYQYRLRLQGKQPKWDPSEQYMSTPKSGFLLRSSIVTGWPGVEVTATTSAPKDSDLPEILRMDKIADGVLFCLARGSLKQLSFREPREGLTFGVDSDGAIKARKSGKTLNIKKDLLRADSRDTVANIAALRRQLAQAEALSEASFGSAQFAAQMIRMPEEQIIEWS